MKGEDSSIPEWAENTVIFLAIAFFLTVSVLLGVWIVG
jgi:hypothetical protein